MNRINAPVLLLNANYVPLSVITARMAVDLLMNDKTEPVDGIAARLRTVSSVFEVPSVLRLKRYVNAPSRKAVWSRRAVLRRDKFRCIFCGRTIGDQQGANVVQDFDLTVDHLIPSSHGGKSTWSNTACACYKCNHKKGSRTPNEAGMKLLWEPKRPRVKMWVASGEIPKEWKIYVES